MLYKTHLQPRDWLKALLLNSLLFVAFAALYFVPGLGQALLTVQFLMFGLPFIATFVVISLIQQFIVPHPPVSGLRWGLLSLAFGMIGLAVVLLLAASVVTGTAADGSAGISGLLLTSLCAALFGAIVGLGQWLAIAHRTRLHAWWVGISAVDYLLVAMLLLRALAALPAAP
jgi:hypothetical protein